MYVCVFMVVIFREHLNIQRKYTHANVDDRVPYWILNLRDGGKGNIKR